MTEEREALQEEIAQTREELGETVEALVNKADVKAQVHEKVEESKDELRSKKRVLTAQIGGVAREPATYWAIAGVAAALLALGRLRRL
ncbi:MAG: hypothetical protein QOG15_2465 [Solirubrobacteraceae bacterium]|jgi:chromosome segregation ATPase|nr:hypothetical protein [Solirubrobacteraceae bacterium]